MGLLYPAFGRAFLKGGKSALIHRLPKLDDARFFTIIEQKGRDIDVIGISANNSTRLAVARILESGGRALRVRIFKFAISHHEGNINVRPSCRPLKLRTRSRLIRRWKL